MAKHHYENSPISQHTWNKWTETLRPEIENTGKEEPNGNLKIEITGI